MNILRLLIERTTTRSAAASFVTAIIGAALLYIAQIKPWWTGHEAWQGLIQELGSLLFVSVAVSVLWELAGKRAFRDELLSVAKLSQDVQNAGLVGLTISFEENIEWEKLFKDTYHLDVLFAYARSWRGTHETKIKRLAAKKDAKIRVFLPDIEDDIVVHDLSRRFGLSHEELKSRVTEAENFFLDARRAAGEIGCTLEVWRCRVNFVFTAYHFDDRTILTLYSHLREKCPPPAFIIESEGRLHAWVETQINGLTDTSQNLATRISPAVSVPPSRKRSRGNGSIS